MQEENLIQLDQGDCTGSIHIKVCLYFSPHMSVAKMAVHFITQNVGKYDVLIYSKKLLVLNK